MKPVPLLVVPGAPKPKPRWYAAMRDALAMPVGRIQKLLGCGPLEADMEQRAFAEYVGRQDDARLKHWKTEYDVWLDYRAAVKRNRKVVLA